MKVSKKLMAIVLTVAFTLGVCSQVMAADPRYTIDGNTITYGDVSKTLSSNSILVMVNGSMVAEPGLVIDGIAYIPVKAVIEELGGTFTMEARNVTLSFGVITAKITQDSRFITVFGKKYSIGADVKKNVDTLYAPVVTNIKSAFGNINIVADSPYPLPVVVIETSRSGSELLYANSMRDPYNQMMSFRNHIKNDLSGSTLDFHQMYQHTEWYKEEGLTNMSDAVKAFIKSIDALEYVNLFSEYCYFTGKSYSVLVNMYSGEIFIAGETFVQDIANVNIVDLMK